VYMYVAYMHTNILYIGCFLLIFRKYNLNHSFWVVKTEPTKCKLLSINIGDLKVNFCTLRVSIG